MLKLYTGEERLIAYCKTNRCLWDNALAGMNRLIFINTNEVYVMGLNIYKEQRRLETSIEVVFQ